MTAFMINFYNGGGTLADVSEGCSWFVWRTAWWSMWDTDQIEQVHVITLMISLERTTSVEDVCSYCTIHYSIHCTCCSYVHSIRSRPL